MISFSNLTSGNGTGGISSIATSSISPTAMRLELITITNKTGSGTPNTPTVSGCGLTWVVVNSIVFDTSGSQQRVTVLRAMGASPTSGALTIDLGGQNQNTIQWSVDEATGMKTTGSNGADAIVQSATNGSSSSSSITATLAAFSDANNATFGGGAQGGGGVTITNGSGFSSLFKGTASDSNTAIMTEWKNSNDTTVDFSVSISSEVGIIGIEIAADVPPAGTSVVDVIGMGVVPFPR